MLRERCRFGTLSLHSKTSTSTPLAYQMQQRRRIKATSAKSTWSELSHMSCTPFFLPVPHCRLRMSPANFSAKRQMGEFSGSFSAALASRTSSHSDYNQPSRPFKPNERRLAQVRPRPTWNWYGGSCICGESPYRGHPKHLILCDPGSTSSRNHNPGPYRVP